MHLLDTNVVSELRKATRETADFQPFGVALRNPWT